GSSKRPSRRCSTNRLRHLHTVWLDVRQRRATSELVLPSAQASTSFARNARFRFTRARSVRRNNSSRSSAERISGAFCRPVGFIPLLDHALTCFSNYFFSRGLVPWIGDLLKKGHSRW